MKIVAAARTRDEAKNIETFCWSYLSGENPIADEVLIADGGSLDETIAIASQLPGVKVRTFGERVMGKGGLWRNPHGRHINFLIDWAKEERADWIIFDDADCFPNAILRTIGRTAIEQSIWPFFYVCRIYIMGTEYWCPAMTKLRPEPNPWEPSMWAWKLDTGLRALESDSWRHEFPLNKLPSEHCRTALYPPCALLHYAWKSEDVIRKKLAFYRQSGEITDMLHPRDFAGKLAKLEDWMRI